MFRHFNQFSSPRGLVVPLVVVGLSLATGTAHAQRPGPAPVVVGAVQQEAHGDARSFVGSVQPVKRATIGSAVDGRVVECPIEEGDRVEAGQVLGQLLTETISLEVASAESELAYKIAQLEELKNGTRPEVIEQARARMAAALAHRDYLRARQNRLNELARGGGAVTQDEYEEAVAATLEAEEQYLEAKAAHEEAVNGPRKETIAQAEAQVNMQQAVVGRLRDQLQKHTIISRFPGYVVTKHSEIGDWVNRGDPIAEVVGVDQVEVVAQVTEQAVARLQAGAQVRAEIPALGNRVFEGEVFASVPQGDLRSRTFPVKIRFDNEITRNGPLLKPGMYARVVIPLGSEQHVTLVPKDAVVHEGANKTIFLVQGATARGQSGTAVPLKVELGVSSGPMVQVLADLPPGQLVVVEGNESLTPGQQITIARVAEYGKPSAAPAENSLPAEAPAPPTGNRS